MREDPTPRDELIALAISVLLTASLMFGATIAACMLLQETGVIP